MFFKIFVSILTFYITHFLIIMLNFKSLLIPILILNFSFITYPIYCSLFYGKIFYCFKHNYFRTITTGLFSGLLLTASGMLLFLPFTVILNFNKILANLTAALAATMWLFLASKFSFTPLIENENPINKILISFKIAKKNSHKVFAATLIQYISIILIIPSFLTVKKHINKLKFLYEENYGGDDGVRTHDLLNAIQTRSQLRHAPEKTAIFSIPSNYNKN